MKNDDFDAKESKVVRSLAVPCMHSLTFIVESIDPINTCALVVPPQDEEVLGVLDLVGQQQADGLEALLAAVHVVA